MNKELFDIQLPCGRAQPCERLLVSPELCKHTQHNLELFFFPLEQQCNCFFKGQAPHAKLIKLSLKRGRFQDGCSPWFPGLDGCCWPPSAGLEQGTASHPRTSLLAMPAPSQLPLNLLGRLVGIALGYEKDEVCILVMEWS